MKAAAELAITLSQTRRQGCWRRFLPVLITVQRLRLSRKRASRAVFPRLARDLCRLASVTQTLSRRAIERTELVSHPGLGEVQTLSAVCRGTNGSAGVSKLVAMAGVRMRRLRFFPHVVTDGTGIVFTPEQPATVADVTAAQAHLA